MLCEVPSMKPPGTSWCTTVMLSLWFTYPNWTTSKKEKNKNTWQYTSADGRNHSDQISEHPTCSSQYRASHLVVLAGWSEISHTSKRDVHCLNSSVFLTEIMQVQIACMLMWIKGPQRDLSHVPALWLDARGWSCQLQMARLSTSMHSETLRSASFLWHVSESKRDNSRGVQRTMSAVTNLQQLMGIKSSNCPILTSSDIDSHCGQCAHFVLHCSLQMSSVCGMFPLRISVWAGNRTDSQLMFGCFESSEHSPLLPLWS